MRSVGTFRAEATNWFAPNRISIDLTDYLKGFMKKLKQPCEDGKVKKEFKFSA
jgi:hypothetical protein